MERPRALELFERLLSREAGTRFGAELATPEGRERALHLIRKDLAAEFGVRPHGRQDRIVTLNHGLGRDSTTMLSLLEAGVPLRVRRGEVIEEIEPEDIDAVVFSDPGAEWQHTYAQIPRARAQAEALGIPFYVLNKPDERLWRGYLSELPAVGEPGRTAALAARPWRHGAIDTIEERAASGWYHLQAPIIEDYRERSTIASRAKADCTEKHKVEPIRKLIEDLARAKFGTKDNAAWGRLVKHGERPPHLSMLGIARDEATRIHYLHPFEYDPESYVTDGWPPYGRPDAYLYRGFLRDGKPRKGGPKALPKRGPWYVREDYPLYLMGITKDEDEQPILDRAGMGDTRKSGCVMCPMQSEGWFWALREQDPDRWQAVVEYEADALARNRRMFILGKKPITEIVEAWRAEHPEATVDEVLDKAYGRGVVECPILQGRRPNPPAPWNCPLRLWRP